MAQDTPPTDASTPPPAPPVDPPADPPTEGEDPAAELERLRARLKEVNAEAAQHRRRAKEADRLEQELEQARQAALSDTERALEDARKEAAKAARDEVSAQYQARLDALAVKAAAAGKFQDPTDVALIDLSALPREEDGSLSEGTLAGAIEALLEAKPHLAARSAGWGDAGGGPRGPNTPPQLTRADLAGMTPEQIVEARQAGRLNQLLGIT